MNQRKLTQPFRWMRTDTATIMFSSLTTKSWGRTFCLTAELRETVDPALLRRAASDVLPHYPSARTSLRQGFFWAYQTVTDAPVQIRAEGPRPLQPITARYKGLPDLRLTYGERRISLEAAHSVGDGRSLIRIFDEILARYEYLREGGEAAYAPIAPPEKTAENAYDTYYDKNGEKPGGKRQKAYHFPETFTDGYMRLLFADMPEERIITLAHERDLTVTEFLCAVLILGVLRTADAPVGKPVTVAVPVDLRRFFPTQSLRNFSIQTYVSFEPAGRTDWTVDEICEATRGQLRAQLRTEELRKSLNKFGSLKTNPVLRIVPYAIKKPVMASMQKKSHAEVTTILTNLGEHTPPDGLSHALRGLRFVNGDTRRYGLPVTCSCVSYNGVLSLCFSRANGDDCWFDACVKILNGLGVEVETESLEGAAPPERPAVPKTRTPWTFEKLKVFFTI